MLGGGLILGESIAGLTSLARMVMRSPQLGSESRLDRL